MSESRRQELVEYLGDPQIRHAYVDATIRQVLAMQIRLMRDAKGWSQGELGKLAQDMSQTQISRLEDPTYAGPTLTTLTRLAKAFDVALLVKFVPFNRLVDETLELTPEALAPKSFDQDTSLYRNARPLGSRPEPMI